MSISVVVGADLLQVLFYRSSIIGVLLFKGRKKN